MDPEQMRASRRAAAAVAMRRAPVTVTDTARPSSGSTLTADGHLTEASAERLAGVADASLGCPVLMTLVEEWVAATDALSDFTARLIERGGDGQRALVDSAEWQRLLAAEQALRAAALSGR